jgi:hypothetical protein
MGLSRSKRVLENSFIVLSWFDLRDDKNSDSDPQLGKWSVGELLAIGKPPNDSTRGHADAYKIPLADTALTKRILSRAHAGLESA